LTPSIARFATAIAPDLVFLEADQSAASVEADHGF